MLIRFLANVDTGRGHFRPGDTDDVPPRDARSLIDAGAAEEVVAPKPAGKKNPAPTTEEGE